MAILNDGSVDSINNLTAGEDSNGKKLNFKQNKEDGTFEADGSDGKRYAITISQGKVSVFDIPDKDKEGTAATTKPASSTTTPVKK